MCLHLTGILINIGIFRKPENKTVFIIEGVKVCKSAWLKCLGIPLSTYYALWTKFTGLISWLHIYNKIKYLLNLNTAYFKS